MSRELAEQARSRLQRQVIESTERQRNRRNKIYFSVPDEVDLNKLDLFLGQLDLLEDKAALITIIGISLSEEAKQKLEALKSIGFDIQFSQKSRHLSTSNRLDRDYQYSGRRRHWSI